MEIVRDGEGAKEKTAEELVKALEYKVSAKEEISEEGIDSAKELVEALEDGDLKKELGDKIKVVEFKIGFQKNIAGNNDFLKGNKINVDDGKFDIEFNILEVEEEAGLASIGEVFDFTVSVLEKSMELDDDLELKIGEKTYKFDSNNSEALLDLAFDVLEAEKVKDEEISKIDDEFKVILSGQNEPLGLEENTLEKIYVQAVKFVNGKITPSVDNFSLILSSGVEINDLSANFGKIDK